MKVYLSIPITGRDIEQVKRELAEVAEKIREKGWEPVSPLDGVTDYNLKWEDYILRDLEILKGCDVFCQIEPEHSAFSYGSEIERCFAGGARMPMITYYMLAHKFDGGVSCGTRRMVEEILAKL